MRLGAHHHPAAAGTVAVAHAGHAIDDACGRKIGRGDDLDQFVDRALGVAQHVQCAVDHFGNIVRRDVGRHADRNAGCAINQQVRNTGRQHRRLAFLAVIVGHEIDRVFFNVGEDFAGNLGQSTFGVTHSRGIVAVNRAEVTLSVDQHIAHRKILRHANQRVVDRLIAVRMILTHHFTDHARAFHVRSVPHIVGLMHREQDPAMDRLQPVPHVRQCAPYDHAHRIIEIALAHLFFEGNRDCFFGELIHWRVG